jgi:hypothetical protein
MTSFNRAAILICGAVILSTVAGATVLAPGGCAAVVPTVTCTGLLTTTAETGTLVAQHSATFDVAVANGLPAQSDAYGTLAEGVYQEAGGVLDFVYQFTETNPAVGLSSVSLASYAGFTTDVNYSLLQPTANPGGLFSLPTAAPGVIPVQATRTGLNGSLINYTFNDGAIGAGGDAGTESAVLIIRTNATTFGPGSYAVQNTFNQTLFGFYAPTPEPRLAGLVVVALFGVVAFFIRRRTAQITN